MGALVAAGRIDTSLGLWIMGIIFGLGAFTFGGPLKTTGEKIVPLGLLTATIISFVIGAITLLASVLGIPQPAVIIYTMAVFAIGSIKRGPQLIMSSPITKKTFYTWCINPTITLLASYALSRIFLK